jgi:prephenate dehydrogenase
MLALRGFEGATLWGVDSDPAAREAALVSGAADAVFETLPPGADILLVCLPPEATVMFVKDNTAHLGSLFCEICGVKRRIVREIAELLPPGVEYIPLHPMAGRETSGFAAADPRLFAGAGLIVTPPDGKPPRRASLIERTARYIGFSEVVYATPEEHDRLIAATSHLPHLAASALRLSLPGRVGYAYAGGAWRGGTRVADAEGFSGLFIENREHTLRAADTFIENLTALRNLIASGKQEELEALLDTARRREKGCL